MAWAAQADPWLDPGDLQLRHDIQLLADAGIIGAPVTAWPMSWGDIDPDPAVLEQAMSAGESAALLRVMARAQQARDGDWRLTARASASTGIWRLRSFEDTPRERAQVGLGANWTGERFALRLRGQYVHNPDDDQEWRADGSYAGMILGNWIFAAATTDRWWGPGWYSNMFLTSNARPIPAFTIDRNSTAPFKSKWLRWIGHWDFMTMFGFLESEREVSHAQFFGMRLTVRPTRWLEFGLSRTALWCGDGRPCRLSTFGNLLLGHDNVGDNVSAADEPGDQLAGYDARVSGAALGVPVALYGQQAGEDEQNLQPALFLTQYGIETWGSFAGGASYRLFVEVSDTLCNGNVFGPGRADVCYNHQVYKTGYRYRGRSIGHTADNDAELYTGGIVLNMAGSAGWSLTATGGKLNREGAPDPNNTVSHGPADYLGVNLVHRRPLWSGSLQAGVGFESVDSAADGRDDNWNFFLRWGTGW